MNLSDGLPEDRYDGFSDVEVQHFSHLNSDVIADDLPIATHIINALTEDAQFPHKTSYGNL